MIKEPTVLVLGAGASQPYGYPLGGELVDQACSELLDGTGLLSDSLAFYERLKMLDFTFDTVKLFATALRGARPYSIDAFLETRRVSDLGKNVFRDLGKTVIADIILRAEMTSAVKTADIQVDWYRYLFNRHLMLRNEDYFREQARNLTIVTFNFDRSFEMALYTAILHGLTGIPTEAVELLQQIPIHHVHGAVSTPGWMTKPELPNLRGLQREHHLLVSVLESFDRIKIVDEEIDKSVVQSAKDALRNAKHVYFVGFGFDDRNVQKLDLPACLTGSNPVLATAFGLTPLEHAPIKRMFMPHQINLYSQDALTFLRTSAEAFTN
jgi:hypothetical protein